MRKERQAIWAQQGVSLPLSHTDTHTHTQMHMYKFMHAPTLCTYKVTDTNWFALKKQKKKKKGKEGYT